MNNHIVEFWSSVQMPAFLGSLVRELNMQGAKSYERYYVDEGSYREVHRFPARAVSRFRAYIGYPFRLMCHARRARRPTIMVVSSNTFYAPRLVQKIRNPNVRVVNWVLDLYPDVLVHAGLLDQNSIVERRLSRMMRKTFDDAVANVFLGHRLLRYAETRFGTIHNAHIIPIGAERHSFTEPVDARSTFGARASRDLRVLYCGNLGAMHEVATIADLVSRPMPEGVQLEFAGHGSGMAILRNAVAECNSCVQFSGPQSQLAWRTKMSLAHIALVTIKSGAERLVMPSKAYSALLAGQALLGVCAADSDLADLIRQRSAGWVVAPGDSVGLKTILQRLQSEPAEVLRCRRNAWRAAQEECDTQKIAKVWRAIFDNVTSRSLKASGN